MNDTAEGTSAAEIAKSLFQFSTAPSSSLSTGQPAAAAPTRAGQSGGRGGHPGGTGANTAPGAGTAKHHCQYQVGGSSCLLTTASIIGLAVSVVPGVPREKDKPFNRLGADFEGLPSGVRARGRGRGRY